MIALGIAGLCKGDFSVIWQPVPKEVPAREALVYLCALISVACGVGLLWQRTAALAARALLLWFLLWLLLLRLPGFFHGFTVRRLLGPVSDRGDARRSLGLIHLVFD